MSATAERGPEAESESPGSRLRRAREHRHYTIQQVARELMLSERVIEAMETEDYAQLPAAAYTCGYLRNYGHLLGLDTDPLVRDFGQHLPPLELHPIQCLNQQIRHDDRGGRTVTLLVFAVLAVLFIFYWQQERTFLTFPAMEAGPPPAPVSAPVVTETLAQGPISITVPVEADTEPAAPDPPRQEQMTAPAEASPDSVYTEEPESLREPAETVEPDAGAQGQIETFFGDGAGFLVLSLSDQCWIEIRDANNERRLMRLGEANDRFSVRGQVPFSLLIGNVSAVSHLLFNGEPVDLSAFARSKVARLTLGE